MKEILIVDFGSRTTNEIRNKLAERRISFDCIPWQEVDEVLTRSTYKGIIFSGSPHAAYEVGAPSIDKGVFEKNIPILGICYGMQFIAVQHGAKVAKAEQEEQTLTAIEFLGGLLACNLEKENFVAMRHKDRVYELPEGFFLTAKTKDCPIAGMECPSKKIYATQYHPEIGGCGDAVLDNFLYKACALL